MAWLKEISASSGWSAVANSCRARLAVDSRGQCQCTRGSGLPARARDGFVASSPRLRACGWICFDWASGLGADVGQRLAELAALQAETVKVKRRCPSAHRTRHPGHCTASHCAAASVGVANGAARGRQRRTRPRPAAHQEARLQRWAAAGFRPQRLRRRRGRRDLRPW